MRAKLLKKLVGVAGFEPATPSPPVLLSRGKLLMFNDVYYRTNGEYRRILAPDAGVNLAAQEKLVNHNNNLYHVRT